MNALLLSKKYPLLFLSALLFFIAAVSHLDRLFFKNSKSFCQYLLYPRIPPNPEWDLPPPSEEEVANLNKIFDQKFYFIGKGAHCLAFCSEDQHYVIKFHRHASHGHLLAWFHTQPTKKGHKIKERDTEKLNHNLLSYKESFESLKEESGLLFVHINPTNYLQKMLTLVDRSQIEHSVPLDQVTFIVQRKADLLYPTLDRLYANGELVKAKQIISEVIRLTASCCQKGFIDLDPAMQKNYGVLNGKAIHIDVGDLVKEESVKQKENRIAYVQRLTARFGQRIESLYPELYPHYQECMNTLSAKGSL